MVKWKYISENENSWVNNKECINKYNKILKMNERLKIGENTKITRSKVNYLLVSIIFLVLFTCGYADEEIKDSFSYCTTNSLEQLDINSLCNSRPRLDSEFEKEIKFLYSRSVPHNFSVYSKLEYEVSGEGKIC